MDTRSFVNSFKLTDWQDQINQIENKYGYINNSGLFVPRYTDQKAIVFDRDKKNITLLPQVNRGSKSSTEGSEHNVDTYALKLAYFNHKDRLTAEDIQDWRQAGTPDTKETLMRATAEKLQDMRDVWDQTQEYMKLNALKGVFKTPDGTTVADMFTEFGISQTTIDFVLGTGTTDVDAKIAALKRGIAKDAKVGGAINGVEVLCDPVFYDKLVSHPTIKTAYQYYQNNGAQRLRDDMANWMGWGVMDVFEHRGVRFVSYDATFTLPSGATEAGIAASTGHAIPKGGRDLFRSYYGPSNKLSQANQVGSELFVRTYADERDEYIDFELESAPLHFATCPAALYKVTTSN